MARPQTKQDLLQAAQTNFEKMTDLIDSIPLENQEQIFPFDDRDRTIRDVLVHLYEWHRLLLNWVDANQNGRARPFFPAPYNWRNYGEMNLQFWKQHQHTPLVQAKQLVKSSHHEVLDLIDDYSTEELFTKKYFSWTGTTSLGSYMVSSTSSHYDWAIKKIKRFKKNCNVT